jgi:NADH-quinone oxidoreductase subunit M
MLAFSSISHVGFVLIGVAAFNIQGIKSAVFQLFNFDIVSSGIFLIAGFIQHRLGSTELIALGGITRPTPILASLFFILSLASMGALGTNGFAAENLIVIGAFYSHTGIGLATLLCIILGATYFFVFYQKAFLGPLTQPAVREAVDPRPREFQVAGTMVSLVLIIGLSPQQILNTTSKSLQTWITHLEITSASSSAAGSP